MCGILGIVGKRPDKNWRAWGLLTNHRGPDAFGLYSDEHVLLGHNRLSILDLRECANQPMTSADGRFRIVFNGEIYNFRELRKDLSRYGYVFKTNSDTEVLLCGYQQWGKEVLQKLDGMFAFVIWDAKEKKIFAARDHIGIKPFFYTHIPGSFIFGSELRLIVNTGMVAKKIRDQSIFEYLAYSYIPAPQTAYQNIFKLMPGHFIEYSLAADQLQIEKWWSLRNISPVTELSYQDAEEELRHLMHQSVKRRMISDVPLGSFLSGGVDSSVISVEMAKIAGSEVQTFTIGYRDNDEYDESRYAVQVAKHLGIRNTVLFPEPKSADLDEYLHMIVDAFDEPYGNVTVILTYLLTKLAREHVTVSLVGDGGDELFAGYPRHLALTLMNRFGPFGKMFAPIALGCLRFCPELPVANHFVRRARGFFSHLSQSPAVAFSEWSKIFSTSQLGQIAQPAYLNYALETGFIDELFSESVGDNVQQACITDQLSFLPNNLLEGADRMSMANAFELRLPYLSRSMLEFAAKLPSAWKLHGKVQKRILKTTYANDLPAEIMRRKKRGFNPPVWHWLQDNQVFVRQKLLSASGLYDYLQPESVRKMVEKFYNHESDYSTQIWMLMVLETWLESR